MSISVLVKVPGTMEFELYDSDFIPDGTEFDLKLFYPVIECHTIELLYLENNIVILLDEDGLLVNKTPNVLVNVNGTDIPLVGTIAFVKYSDDEEGNWFMHPLTDEDINYIFNDVIKGFFIKKV